jgi:hypothetical protein
MSDQNQVSEPGWEAPTETSPTPTRPASTPQPETTARPRRPRRNPVSTASPSTGPTTTGPVSSPAGDPFASNGGGPTPPPAASSRVLTDIISNVLAGATSVVSMYTTRRWNVSAQLRDEEARNIARPIARLIQRRTQIRRELDDAADGAGVIASFLQYVERVAASAGTDTPTQHAATRSSDFTEVRAEPRAPQHERVESFVDQARPNNASHLEPGSGETRSIFLSGFDEIRPTP